jgi:hypothetical protein
MHLYRFTRIGAAVLAALAIGGCGGGAEPPGVATAGSGGAGAGPTANSGVVEQYVSGVREYVRCMRAEGVNLPDPDAKGRIDYNSLGGGAVLKKDPKFLAASLKCKDLMPPVPEELQDKGPPLTAEQIRYAREYSQCMRANGQPDFPDPGPDGHWPHRSSDEQMSEQEAAASLRAQEFCAPVLNGKPPATPDPNRTLLG